MHEATIQFFRDQIQSHVDVVIILGSGLGGFADTFPFNKKISAQNIPDYPQSTVPGHSGIILFGNQHNKNILIFQGRIHSYEGYTYHQLTLPIRIAYELGANTAIITNAAGSLRSPLQQGDLMLITDFIWTPFARSTFSHLHHTAPLNQILKKFLDFSRYTAKDAELQIREGTYCFLSGPMYETRAEIRALRKMGGDAVGMSTVPEFIAASYYGLDVIAISCITNSVNELRNKVTHTEVTEVANKVGPKFCMLLNSILERI